MTAVLAIPLDGPRPVKGSSFAWAAFSQHCVSGSPHTATCRVGVGARTGADSRQRGGRMKRVEDGAGVRAAVPHAGSSSCAPRRPLWPSLGPHSQPRKRRGRGRRREGHPVVPLPSDPGLGLPAWLTLAISALPIELPGPDVLRASTGPTFPSPNPKDPRPAAGSDVPTPSMGRTLCLAQLFATPPGSPSRPPDSAPPPAHTGPPHPPWGAHK